MFILELERFHEHPERRIPASLQSVEEEGGPLFPRGCDQDLIVRPSLEPIVCREILDDPPHFQIFLEHGAASLKGQAVRLG